MGRLLDFLGAGERLVKPKRRAGENKTSRRKGADGRVGKLFAIPGEERNTLKATATKTTQFLEFVSRLGVEGLGGRRPASSSHTKALMNEGRRDLR